MASDAELLKRYATDRSEPAFAELVARHLDLVYASARRQVGDAALAEDISQVVFTMLAQKAASLRPNVVLPAWLMTATWYASQNALRQRRRRRIHESKVAAMMSEVSPSSGVEADAASATLQQDAVLQLDQAVQ